MLPSGQILHKTKDLFSSRWGPSVIRAFIECVHDDVNRDLSWEFEHRFETLCKCGLAGLFGAITTIRVESRKDSPAIVRVVTKLSEKGRQQATNVALGDILEIEVIVCDQG
jgi:hypothetical protein